MGNSLSDWSAVLDRHFDEQRKRDDQELQEIKDDIPYRIGAIDYMDNEVLLTEYEYMRCRSYADPRKTIAYAPYVEAMRNEILSRMSE